MFSKLMCAIFFQVSNGLFPIIEGGGHSIGALQWRCRSGRISTAALLGLVHRLNPLRSNPNSMWSVLFPIPPLLFASPYKAMSSPLSSPPSCLCPALSLTKKFQRAALDNNYLAPFSTDDPHLTWWCSGQKAENTSLAGGLRCGKSEKVKGACLPRLLTT
ncbi:uncharacterized protein EI90DRAFT_3012101 [Cantharellus anzutake]|uniref:uncharacterized protein n=1 Tax=Cantharellus anzutake TaxID=1750568 RepID=UPI001908534E|nr:uncharacterized protein EI90DRAFT_3012101 [Cantharellus anzutake]KAF8341555.1 hypothetical protein EI90DRAFT_3012101 [Cantharellus anzutake]